MFLVAFLLSTTLSLVSMPAIIAISKRKGWYDGHSQRKIHTGEVSRLGGVGISLAFFATLAVLALVPNELRQDLVIGVPLLLLVLGIGAVHAMGVIDDFKNLPALSKLGIQILGGLLVGLAGVQVRGMVLPFSGIWIDFGFLSLPLTVAWIIGISNAINLIDGLDGLAGSTSLVAALSFAAIHALTGGEGGLVLSLVIAGAITGFLCFNRPKAALFMGDGGAYLLGMVLAALPLVPQDFFSSIREYQFLDQLNLTLPWLRSASGAPVLDVLGGMIVLILPVADMLAAIVRRRRRGVPFHTPDREHLHHKLLDFKFSAWAILGMVAVANAVFGLAAWLGAWHRIQALEGNGSWLLAGLFPVLGGILALGLFYWIHEANKQRKRKQSPRFG